jgi:serine/threonine-protein kinase
LTLTPGSRLGPYQVTAKLGEGGMGEVWRATDSNLGRDVALKVLPEAFTADVERLARFEREAKLLAQLNHPNIAHVYGFEASGPTRALVMELVEGEDLAQRLAHGPLPLDDALPSARQIAEALEAAHERGIVHRDLKPANVKIAPNGTVKVLDFGLAKAMDASERPGSSTDVARSPTLMNSPTLTQAQGTQLGVILGTAAYMSPEQAKGAAVDKRADIWAFGVVLWEMLTGRRLFEGDSVPETLAGVLKSDVDLGALPATTPASLRLLLRRCLERNPRNRLHDMGDARIVLDELLAGGGKETPAVSPTATVPPRRSLLLVAGLALLFGGLAGWLLHSTGGARATSDARWALALPEGYALSTSDSPQVAISRDGRLQAIVAVDGSGSSRILLRANDAFAPRVVAGSEGAVGPFFSPTADWIGFFRDDALMKIPTTGGPAIRLAPVVAGGRGGVWADDGFVYFSADYAGALSRVSAAGGDAKPVTQLDAKRSERTHRWPDVLPEGDAVLFTSDTEASTEYYDDARIEVVRPSTGERKVLVEGASQARFAPGGFVVFARAGSLYAVRFDPRSLTTGGVPQEVARGIATNVGSGAAQFAISASGAAVWAPGDLAAAYRIVWVGRDGNEAPVALPPAPYQELALSPDGRKLAVVGGQGGVSDLSVADLERGTVTRLTSGKFVRAPAWSPDGSHVAFSVFAEGQSAAEALVDWQVVDGSRPAETLVPQTKGMFPSGFSPDGKEILFDSSLLAGNDSRVTIAPVDRNGRPAVFSDGASGVVSPDGRWLAYVGSESGQDVIYVRPYPAGGGRWQVSAPSGNCPRWSRDGRALYFLADSVLFRATVDGSRGFSAGRPEAVLDRAASGTRAKTFDLAPDGRIVTFRAPPGAGAQHSIDLDLGFASRLAELVGEKR